MGPTSSQVASFIQLVDDASSSAAWDPLVFSLDGNPIVTAAMNAESGEYFDTEGTGFAHPTGWIGANDGVLFLDNSGLGVLENGTQLFSTSMSLANGSLAETSWQALAQFDINNSGIINSVDPIFNDLFIQTGAGQVYSLAELGISSINLNNSAVNTVDNQGNTELSAGSFTYANGVQGAVADYSFQQSTVQSYQLGFDQTSISSDQADASGFGVVGDLQVAESQDTSGTLSSLVQSFESSNDLVQQQVILKEILTDWTGSQDAPYAGTHMDAQTFAIVEKFYGENLTFLNGATAPGVLQADDLYPAYEDIAGIAYGQLMLSGTISDLGNLINVIRQTDGSAYYDLSAVANSLIQQDQTDPTAAALRTAEFLQSINGLSMISESNYSAFYDLIAAEAPGLLTVLNSTGLNPVSTMDNDTIDRITVTQNETVTASGSNDHILLGSGNVTLNDSGNNSWIQSGGGNDTVSAGTNATVYLGNGNDIISVSGGNSLVSAGQLEVGVGATGAGNYVVVFGTGSGAVTFIQGEAGVGNDSILFGAGISANDIVLTASGADLVIGLSGSNDTLDLVNELVTTGSKQIQSYEFADGTTLTAAEFGAIGTIGGTGLTLALSGNNTTIDRTASYVAETDTVSGTNDMVSYGSGAVQVTDTGSGNTFRAGYGDFSIMADANDTIYAGSGNDTIIAGSNNQITAGSGSTSVTLGSNDTVASAGYDLGSAEYILAEGTGTTTIGAGFSDTVVFGAGINASDLAFTSDGYSLNIALNDGSGDELNLGNELTTPRDTEFEFANDTTYTLAQLTENGVLVTNSTDDVAGLSIVVGVNERLMNTGSYDNAVFGDGNDSIVNAGSSDNFVTGSGTQVVTDSGTNNVFNADAATGTVNFTAGVNDTLDVYGANLTVTGADGDNIQQIGSGSYSIVSGGDSTFSLGSGNGTITAGANDSIFYTGNATIYAGTNDTISDVGGSGSITVGSNDTFLNPENDTLYLNSGTGTTTINDQGGSNDLIVLGTGITANDLTFSSSGEDLTIGLGTGDNIVISNNFANSQDQYELQFSDNSTASLASLMPAGLNVDISDSYGSFTHEEGVDENVSVSGSYDTVALGDGNDTVNMSGYSDSLSTGTGNSTIDDTGYGNQTSLGGGNDTVTLGTNSQVFGGTGTDDFQVSAGIGSAQISDYGTSQTDALYFNGYSVNDVSFSIDPSDGLVVNLGDGDSVDLVGAFGDNKIGSFVFDDATLSQSEFLAMAPDAASTVENNSTLDESASTSTQYIFDSETGNTVDVGSGYTTVYASSSSDETLNLGSGTSYVVAGTNDQINEGSGDSYIYPVNGDATVTTGSGTTNLTQYAGDLTLNVSADSGNSVISTYFDDGSDTGNTILNLGAGLDPSDLIVSQSNNDLVFGFDDSNATITFQNQLLSTADRQITVNFGDASTMSYSELQSNNMLTIDNTTDSAFIDQPDLGWPVALTNEADDVYAILGANDFVTNTGYGDTFITGAGNQSINDTGTNNYIDTTASDGTVSINAGANDTVYAGEGDSTITGAQNDYIAVNGGNSTIVSGGQSTLVQNTGTSTITAGDDDTVYVNSADSTTMTGASNDVLVAWDGSSSINFTAGANDTVYTSQANDILNIGVGSGTTSIIENTQSGASLNGDTIVFGAGITANDLSFTASSDDVDIFINGNDSVDLHEFAGSGEKQVTQFDFADDTSETLQQLLAGGLTLNNSSDGATINRYSSTLDETLNLTGSGDTVYGSIASTNETINTVGNDYLYTNGANVTITSGYNDLISGDSGTMNITAASATFFL
jgi:hypothetical protein